MERTHHDWTIEFHSGVPVYRQIINMISTAIANGTLKEGAQLPTIRTLCETLDVNPNTVAKAYRELELKGVISTERGSGCFVAPPSKERVRLSAKEKRTRMDHLISRMAAEAQLQGIPLEDLMEHLQQRKSHAQ
jgi:GntR family transcriptional regulator